MNTEKFKRLRAYAERTIKILDLIKAGKTSQQIVEKLGVNRQLVEYYIKALSKE